MLYKFTFIVIIIIGRWTCDWRSRVQSQPLHCRVSILDKFVRTHTFASVTKQYNLVPA